MSRGGWGRSNPQTRTRPGDPLSLIVNAPQVYCGWISAQSHRAMPFFAPVAGPERDVCYWGRLCENAGRKIVGATIISAIADARIIIACDGG